jgi:hypothetical protein
LIMHKHAKAGIVPIRQRTQFSCVAASMTMALGANGVETDEDEVNRVMGCKPMQGATWEQAIACAQHWGMRATLVSPCTLGQLKEWTDRGIPVLIAWNPEGRDWSHASCVFDVDAEENIYVADPNCPDPEQTVRVVPKTEFYGKWFEKWPNYLVRRPALAIEREITSDGRQVRASRVAATQNPSIVRWEDKFAIKFVTRKWEDFWMGNAWKHSMYFGRNDEPKLFPSESAAKREIKEEVIPYIFRWQPGYDEIIRGWDLPIAKKAESASPPSLENVWFRR